MIKKDNLVLEYSNHIPKTIAIAVKQVFGKRVIKVIKKREGVQNYVFKVVTGDTVFSVKVFRYPFVKKDELRFRYVDRKLNEYNIKHPTNL